MSTATSPTREMTITNGTIGNLLLEVRRVIRKHQQLYECSEESHPWLQLWNEWVSNGITACKTARAAALILYKEYDRKSHNINYIVETLRTEVPILDEYYSFTTIGDYDDVGLVPKTLTFFEMSDVTIQEIYTPTETARFIDMIVSNIEMYLQSRGNNEVTWINTWLQYVKDGLELCGDTEALCTIICPTAKDKTFASVLTHFYESIPYLKEKFTLEVYNDNVILFMQNSDESEWQPVPTKTAAKSANPEFFTPATTSYHEKNTNPFGILDEQGEIEEQEEEELSVQLSQKFNANITTESNKSSIASNISSSKSSLGEPRYLEETRYKQIATLIRENRHDEITMEEFELYILTNIKVAKAQFEADVEEMKSNTTKSMSHHKNNLQKELERKTIKFETSTKEVQQKVDKLRKDMREEEVRCITAIAAKGQVEGAIIDTKLTEANRTIMELKDITKYTNEIVTAANASKKHIHETMTTSYNSFYTDVQDTMEDNKTDFTEWIQRRVEKVYNREDELLALVKDQKELLRNQKVIIEDLSKRVSILEHATKQPSSHSSTSGQNDRKSRADPPETPPPFQPSPMMSRFRSTPEKNEDMQYPIFSPPRMQPERNEATRRPMQKFFSGAKIKYKKGLLYFVGQVVEAIWKGNQYVYTLSMESRTNNTPTMYYNCQEDGITRIVSTSPEPFNPTPIVDEDDSDDDVHDLPSYENDHNLGDNEYKLHENSTLKRINSHQILKHAKDWSIQIVTKDDIQRVYARWKNNFGYYNIPLKVWDKITAEQDILDLPTTCLNYKAARTTMSSVIFDYFEANKDNLFEIYKEPKYILKAFENQADGLGFMKNLLTIAHPKLRDVTDYKKMSKPKFGECHDIHDFVAKYLQWLNEEKMLNNRKYNHKENIDYILSELDSRFETIRIKIERRMNEIYANPEQPLPFPSQFKTNEKLSLNLMNLIPFAERQITDFTNEIPTVNKVMTRSAAPNQNPYNRKRKNQSNEWAKVLKWELTPGATCSACGQNNHEIYKTGCPAMAIFCNCKAFYDKTDPKKLAPVLEQFTTFKAEQRKKQKARKKEMRATIKRLTDCGAEEAQVNKVFMDQYLEEFPAEEYAITPIEFNSDDSDEE